jgi:hypothetical protein
MRRAWLAVVLTVAAFPLAAGTVMELDCHSDSTSPYSFVARISIDGPNARFDVIEGMHPVFNPKITVISRDEGETLIIIDHKQKTYFIRKSRAMSGPISTWKAPGGINESKVSFDVDRGNELETIAGRSVRRYRAQAEYDISMKLEGEKMSAHVKSEGTFWTIEGRNDALPFGLEFAFKSGFDSLDHKVGRRLPRIGLPLKQSVSVTRTISGGAPITERFDATATKVSDEKLDFAIFEPPVGYRFREPTFGFE